jgi:DNA-binding NtrC family response regulator
MSDSRSILIVEDEPLIAMMLEDFLESLGHRVVGAVETVEDAMVHIDEGGIDVAIIDVRLKNGQQVWPLADRLAGDGIPYILATGGHIQPPPERHADATMLAKPYTIDAIGPAILAACAAKA